MDSKGNFSFDKKSSQTIDKNNEYKDCYDPNNSMEENYINLSQKKEESLHIDNSMIAPINYKNSSIEEAEENEDYEVSNENNNIINFVDLCDNDGVSEISEVINHNLESKNFLEMPENLSIIGKEPSLDFNNEESFTKEVDNMIKKLHTPITDSNLNVLMIAEKPSIARTITRILSDSFYTKYQHNKINIFSFQDKFKGKRADFTITSVRGHIYDNKYVYNYDENDPVSSYDYNIIKILKNNEINIKMLYYKLVIINELYYVKG